MKRILILLTTFSLLFLSCQEKRPVKQNPIDTTTSTKPDKKKVAVESNDTVTVVIPTWQTVNDDLESKYQSRIEFNDVERVYKLLLKEKLIDKNALIDESYYPTFTHLSPTVMLDDVVMGSRHSERPKEMRVFTYQDKDFILAQQRLRSTKEFRWSSLTDKIAKPDSYPNIEIGIPVFSIDKKKFIVQIQESKSKDCIHLISYLFVTIGNQTKHYVFEEVTSC